jgi:hypothetical protein
MDMDYYPAVLAVARRHDVDLSMTAGATHGLMGDYVEMTPGSDPFEAVERDLDETGVDYDWRHVDDDTENRGYWEIRNRPRGR